MNKNQLNPNWVTLVLLVTLVGVVAIFPFSIEIKPNTSAAQSTPKTVEYTLKTLTGQTPPMAFIGVGGSIDGVVNPDLTANTGDTVKITLINGDPIIHDLAINDFGVSSGQLTQKDQQVTITFVPDRPGEFVYHCTIPGHHEVGMAGKLIVTGEALPQSETHTAVALAAVPTAAPANPNAVSVIHNPTDLPAPVGSREPTHIRIDLVAQEVVGQLADGTTFSYFTFNGTIPGPMFRMRVGDTAEVHMKNDTTSVFPHSVDFHAVTGPGGGAVYTQTNPGEETVFSFQALNPGLYVYHCATPSVAHHIANGMYGLILVEPEGGLPPVSREFYVMQGEVYTAQPFGAQGHLDFSHEKMLNEDPEYFTFNGAAGALTLDDYALRANVGETARIFFGVGGPNFISSFHVIGEIFDRVYDQASLTSPPLTDVQTTTVPPGGATMVEFKLEVPGRYILVDHALSRLERGLAGYLYVEGAENPDVFYGDALTEGSGH
jgi:nitrite reductase (NO-forming)